MTQHNHRTAIRTHRIILGFSIVCLFTWLLWSDIRTDLVWTETPKSTHQLIKKQQSPNDSPIITWEDHPYWLLNQPTTNFKFRLTDIFEQIEITAYYQSPQPEQLVMNATDVRSIPKIDVTRISIFDGLSDPNWPWIPEVTAPSNNLLLYKKPGLPDNFPPFEDFIRTNTVERLIDEAAVFIVKNDQNFEYRPITADFSLVEIAYILIPKIESLKYEHTTEVAPNTYVVSINDHLRDEHRAFGAEYEFNIQLSNYHPGDWAIIDRFEVKTTRNPVTLESIQQFIKNTL